MYIFFCSSCSFSFSKRPFVFRNTTITQRNIVSIAFWQRVKPEWKLSFCLRFDCAVYKCVMYCVGAGILRDERVSMYYCIHMQRIQTGLMWSISSIDLYCLPIIFDTAIRTCLSYHIITLALLDECAMCVCQIIKWICLVAIISPNVCCMALCAVSHWEYKYQLCGCIIRFDCISNCTHLINETMVFFLAKGEWLVVFYHFSSPKLNFDTITLNYSCVFKPIKSRFSSL